MDTILLCTDGTEASHAATQYAIDLARTRDVALHVLAVRPTTFFGSSGPAFVTSLEEVHAARAVAAETANAASAAGVEAHPHDVEGDDADVIVRVAAELEVGMIVVGCRDAGSARRGHAGSVSQTLAATSAVPVTVVRAEA